MDAPDLSADFVAIRNGHNQVQQNSIGLGLEEQGQSLNRVGDAQDTITSSGEDFVEAGLDAGIIVDAGD